MIKPRPVTKNQPVRADDYNKLLAYMESLTVRGTQGGGIRVNSSPQGTTLSLVEDVGPQAQGGGGRLIHPFQITDASDGTGASVNIRFGLLNDVTPTLDDSVTELTTLTQLVLTPPATTGTWKVVLIAAIVDDDTILVPELDYVWVITEKDYDGSGEDPALIGHQIIAEVDVLAGDGDTVPDKVTDIRQVVTHSLRHQICNRQLADAEASPPITFSAGNPVFWGV